MTPPKHVRQHGPVSLALLSSPDAATTNVHTAATLHCPCHTATWSQEFSPWLTDVTDTLPPSADPALDAAVAALLDGEIIGWWQGRAEVGARALGHRSILADPRRADTHRRVNDVKRREQFRPLAPSCLADHASDWFEALEPNASPYMSITAMTKPEKRAQVRSAARGVTQ